MPPGAWREMASAGHTQRNWNITGKETVAPGRPDFLSAYQSMQKSTELWWAAEVIWEDVKRQIPITIFSLHSYL